MTVKKNGVALALVKAVAVSVAVAFVFYSSLFGLIPGAVVGVYVFRIEKEKSRARWKRKTLLQFKNMISALQAGLEAGNSMERAFISATNDMRELYGTNSDMVFEMEKAARKLELSIPLEVAFSDMAKRYDLSEIYDFAEIITVIKRTGGNTVQIIRSTVEKLTDEIELDAELEVIVAAKRFEQQVMVYMPAMITVFLRVSNKGFLSPLYGNLTGILIMTVVLGANIGADYLGRRIVDIN